MAEPDPIRTTAPMVIDIPGTFDSGWLEGSAFGQAVAGQMPWDDPQFDNHQRALGAAWAKARRIGGPRGSYRLRLTLHDAQTVWALVEMADTAYQTQTEPEERTERRAASTVLERAEKAALGHYQQQFPVGCDVTFQGQPMTVAGIVVDSYAYKVTVVLHGTGVSNTLADACDPALVKTSKEDL